MLYSDFINNGGELVFRGDSLTHTYTEGFTIDIDVANIHVLEPSASGIVVVLPNSTSLLAENQIFVNNTDFDVSLEVDGTAYLLASKTVFFFSWNGTKWIKGKGSVIELLASNITAKSVVLDIADTYGTTRGMNVRSVEFFNNDVLIPMLVTDFVARATTYHNADYHPAYAFRTDVSKVGTVYRQSWNSADVALITNQRLSITFNQAQTFNKVVINNCTHNVDPYQDRCIKNTVITASPDEITSTVYGNTITNPTVLFDGVIPQHVIENVVDDFVVWQA